MKNNKIFRKTWVWFVKGRGGYIKRMRSGEDGEKRGMFEEEERKVRTGKERKRGEKRERGGGKRERGVKREKRGREKMFYFPYWVFRGEKMERVNIGDLRLVSY